MSEITVAQKFSKLASDYCAFLEDHCAYSARQFTAHCAEFLAAIDQSVTGLPLQDDSKTITVDVGPTNWIARNITEKVGNGALSDDLTAIYRYLKQGLLIHNTDPAMAGAYWKSHFSADCQPSLKRAQAGLI